MHRNIQIALAQKRNLLEPEALALFGDYGLPVPEHVFAATREAAIDGAERLGFPVVLKVVSGQIVHKSDAGGVQLNLANAEQTGLAYDRILAGASACHPGATVDGVLVVRQAARGTECIVGAVRDEQFGHCVMFGLGGVAVELFRDVSFRVLPLTRADACEMISETRAAKLLGGFRGERPGDVGAVVDALLRVSRMLEENPQIKELDINPLVVYDQGVLILDGRVML